MWVKHGKHNQASHGRKGRAGQAGASAYSAARASGASVAEARTAARAAVQETRAQERADAQAARVKKLEGRAEQARRLSQGANVTEAQRQKYAEQADRFAARARGERVGEKKPLPMSFPYSEAAYAVHKKLISPQTAATYTKPLQTLMTQRDALTQQQQQAMSEVAKYRRASDEANLQRQPSSSIRVLNQAADQWEAKVQEYERELIRVHAAIQASPHPRELLFTTPPSTKSPTFTTTRNATWHDADQQRVQRVHQEVLRMTTVGVGSKGVTYKASTETRPSCTNRTIDIPPSTSERVIAHEIGHAIENTHPSIQTRAREFLEQRTRNEPLQSLRSITGDVRYGANEMTTPDRFIDPYIGKRYTMSDHTEIISMGIEHLYHDPITLARADPDYFMFLFDTLNP